MELRLKAHSARFDPADDRWQRHVDGLLGELRHVVPSVRRAAEPVHGAKGGFESFVVVLGSAGVVTGVFELLKAWIGSDRTRSVTASWYEDGTLQQVEVSGRLDDEVVERALHTLVERLHRTG